SRRRHTRCLSDWSSDVCSSDLSVHLHLLDDSQEPKRSKRSRHVFLLGCDLSNESRTSNYHAHSGIAPSHLRRLRSRLARQSGRVCGVGWGASTRILPRCAKPLILSAVTANGIDGEESRSSA